MSSEEGVAPSEFAAEHPAGRRDTDGRAPAETEASVPYDGQDEPGRVRTLYRGLQTRPTGLLVALACASIVLYSMRFARGILAPILLAMFIVMGLSPILDWLRRRKVPAWAAITVVMLGFLVVALLLVAILASSLGQLSSQVPVYQQNLSRIFTDVQNWFGDRGIDISGLTGNALRPDKIIGWVTSSLRLLISLLSSGFMLILIVAFMIAEVYSFPRKMHYYLQLGPGLSQAFVTFAGVTRKFLFTLTWLNLLTSILVAAVYYAFRVDFALLWVFVFFLLSFIPNIGFVLSVIPPFFVVLLEQGFARAAIVVAIVILFNGFVNNAIAPRYLGQRSGLSTLAVFLSLILWAWVLGPIGALMAVPLMLMVKLLFFESYESTRPLSGLISPMPKSFPRGDSPPSPQAGVSSD